MTATSTLTQLLNYELHLKAWTYIYRYMSVGTSRVQSSGFPKIVYFNHCDLKKTLPKYEQCVTCAALSDRTLDLFYSSVHSAYRSEPSPPFDRSDHNLVHLLPSYRPVVQRKPPVTKTVGDWLKDSSDALRVC